MQHTINHYYYHHTAYNWKSNNTKLNAMTTAYLIRFVYTAYPLFIRCTYIYDHIGFGYRSVSMYAYVMCNKCSEYCVDYELLFVCRLAHSFKWMRRCSANTNQAKCRSNVSLFGMDELLLGSDAPASEMEESICERVCIIQPLKTIKLQSIFTSRISAFHNF